MHSIENLSSFLKMCTNSSTIIIFNLDVKWKYLSKETHVAHMTAHKFWGKTASVCGWEGICASHQKCIPQSYLNLCTGSKINCMNYFNICLNICLCIQCPFLYAYFLKYLVKSQINWLKCKTIVENWSRAEDYEWGLKNKDDAILNSCNHNMSIFKDTMKSNYSVICSNILMEWIPSEYFLTILYMSKMTWLVKIQKKCFNSPYMMAVFKLKPIIMPSSANCWKWNIKTM